MAISANTLFHFTSQAGLLGIIKSKGFRASCSFERFSRILPRKSSYTTCYIPMVSFCDLKMTQITQQHIKDFGKFGIGLNKNWGVKNNLSPVLYVHENSNTTKHINTIFGLASELKANKLSVKNMRTFRAELLKILTFTKPYKSYYQRNKRRKIAINHYDEREWRYLADFVDPNIISGQKDRENSKLLAYVKQKISQPKRFLKFGADDIKYFVVKDTDTLQEVVRKIKQSFRNVKESNELITKIITIQEIVDDF